jgi:hypothetical protein
MLVCSKYKVVLSRRLNQHWPRVVYGCCNRPTPRGINLRSMARNHHPCLDQSWCRFCDGQKEEQISCRGFPCKVHIVPIPHVEALPNSLWWQHALSEFGGGSPGRAATIFHSNLGSRRMGGNLTLHHVSYIQAQSRTPNLVTSTSIRFSHTSCRWCIKCLRLWRSGLPLGWKTTEELVHRRDVFWNCSGGQGALTGKGRLS